MIAEIAEDIKRGHTRGPVPTDVWLCREWWLALVDEMMRLGAAPTYGQVIVPSWSLGGGARETIVRPLGGEA